MSSVCSAVAPVTDADLLRPEITVQESCVNQQIDEISTVIFAARVEDECEGYLIQKHDNHYETHVSCQTIHQFTAIFHRLLLQYISIENELYEKERDDGSDTRYHLELFVSLDGLDENIRYQLEHIGLSSESSQYYEESDGLGVDLSKYIPFLHEFAFIQRGTEQGNSALLLLEMLSKRRVPFDFSAPRQVNENDTEEGRRRNVISHQRGLLPSSVIDEVMEIVDEIKLRGWLSDNQDSVDRLPSLHLNLISNGKPLFEKADGDGTPTTATTFEECICILVDILSPHLYGTLLPTVRKVTNNSTVEISDVFIRNYGQIKASGSGDEDEAVTRYSLSGHYDVTAYATCVVTLDSTACIGRNGLYTILPTSTVGATNHAALRQFFPLDKGDGVCHTFDIFHGVDVDPKLNKSRTSLIIWFTDNGKDEDQRVNQPWLLNPTDDIGEFILGLASESKVEEDGSDVLLKKNAVDPYSLYLSSATKGNIFSMIALAQLCHDDILPNSQYDNVYNILASRDEFNPFLPTMTTPSNDENACIELANASWYHAAIQGGHRGAQISLADDIMHQYMSLQEDISPAEEEDMLIMASVLFALASAQGYDTEESLTRLMGVEYNRLNTMGIEVPSEDFFASPVVQVLMMFLEPAVADH